jgi:hypothetical protein
MSRLPQCVFAFAGDRRYTDVVAAVISAADSYSPDASLWLWLRGGYDNGSLSMSAWKAIIELKKAGWLVRNEVVLGCKVADPAPENRLKRGHENLYHLSRSLKYYYDRTMGSGSKGLLQKNNRGVLVTKSGVVGSKYATQITESPFMTEDERANAMKALNESQEMMLRGEISDFRMCIKGVHKVTRAVATMVEQNGFYIRRTKSHSDMVSDLWPAFSSETNSCMPRGVVLSILRLSCEPGGDVFDIFPSPAVAKVVAASGRAYVAMGVGGVELTSPEEDGRIFDPEEAKSAQIQAEI